MRAAKIVIEAPVVSFRYPHFLVGRQLTYKMPPPSTIYGHICSCAGELIPHEDICFAYSFNFKSSGSDLEHQHKLSRTVNKKSCSYDITVDPVKRDYLFECRLTLYLMPEELGDYFKEPVFCLNLGRSQDLARVVSVSVIDIKPSEGVYIRDTLLPFSMRTKTYHGITVIMPRYISPPPEREPLFERYIELRDCIFAGKKARESEKFGNRLVIEEENEKQLWLSDPSDQKEQDMERGLIFHTLTGGKDGDVSRKILGKITG